METKGKGMAFESFTVEDIGTRAATIHTLRRGAGPPALRCFFCMDILRRISSGTKSPIGFPSSTPWC